MTSSWRDWLAIPPELGPEADVLDDLRRRVAAVEAAIAAERQRSRRSRLRNGRAKRSDHVLCGLALVATPLPVMAIDDTTPLPSRALPSDHVPIGVAITG